MFTRDAPDAAGGGAADGVSALGICRVDLAILDVMMPGLTGLEVTAEVRSDPVASATRILLVSAVGTRADRHRGLDVRADDSLTKPFDLAGPVRRVRGLIGDDADEAAHV